MLETVLEPAINAPRLPIQGETKGHMPSNACAAEVANTLAWQESVQQHLAMCLN